MDYIKLGLVTKYNISNYKNKHLIYNYTLSTTEIQ